ncbi:MAG: TolC family protein [Verrucomicrobia bacterium]|nr:TolC family protein [Verrucomicrobiota bacterium]
MQHALVMHFGELQSMDEPCRSPGPVARLAARRLARMRRQFVMFAVAGCLGSAVAPAGESVRSPVPRTVASASVAPAPPVSGPPYTLDLRNIVALAFHLNPSVRASREEMKAARHGLEEFRANLNRLEPYVEMRNQLTRFPFQRSGVGHDLTSVVGVQKESFEGSLMKLEVGPSVFSRFNERADELSPDPRDGEAGAFIGTRVEFPFLGSRRRQDRIISQAFQESTARKAQLDYLKSYRVLVDNALSYYNLTIYYQRLLTAYQVWGEDLGRLLTDSRVRQEDRPRVESVKASAESTRGQYAARAAEYRGQLLGYLGLDLTNEVTIVMPEYMISAVAVSGRTPEGMEQLIQKARENNPAFEVLENAIRNAQLQHDQAVRGKFDITTFLEGTLFPFGSSALDSRSSGWAVGGGVNVRLNDARARGATRLKTEALIRQFEAEIEAEEISIRRRIQSTTTAIWDNDANREQLLEVGRQKLAEYEQRQREYFDGNLNIDQLMSTRSEIASNAANLVNLVYNSADREATLILATGQIYEMVGLKIADRDMGVTPPEGGRRGGGK